MTDLGYILLEGKNTYSNIYIHNDDHPAKEED